MASIDGTASFEKWASRLKLGTPHFDVTPDYGGGSRQIGFRCKLTVPAINSFVGHGKSTSKKEARANAARDFGAYLVRKGVNDASDLSQPSMHNKSLSGVENSDRKTVTGVEKASEEKKMAASAEGKQIAVSSKIGATNEQSVYSSGETLIRKLPDELLANILAELDHTEHVRSERVSKWFRRVNLKLSWHNVTVVIDHHDEKLRKNFGSYLNFLQKHLATQALFKRCKRLNELCLSVKLDHFPLYVNEHSRSLKHLSIRSEPMSLNSNGMKLFSRLFPLQGFQSLRIKFSTFKSDEFTELFEIFNILFECASFNEISTLQLFNLATNKYEGQPICHLPPNIRFLRLATDNCFYPLEFPLAVNFIPAGVLGNIRALSLKLNRWSDSIERFRSLIYLDLKLWNHRDQKFLIALAQTDAFANLRALKFSTFLYKDDDDEKPNPYQNLFIGCPNLEHLQFGYLCSSPKNVESLCKGLTSRAASHLKSLGLNFSDGIVAKKSLKVLLASLPPSLEAISLNGPGLRTKKDKFKQMSIYQSMDELWIDYGLPVAMSVLDQPPSSPIFYL